MTKKEKYNGYYETEAALNKPAATVVNDRLTSYKLKQQSTRLLDHILIQRTQELIRPSQ